MPARESPCPSRLISFASQLLFAAIATKQIRRGAHRSTQELEAAIYRSTAETKREPTPFIWTKTADEILASVAWYCQRITDTQDASGPW